MTVYFIDHDNGNNSNNGQSFANRKKTFDSLGTLATNDEVRVMASPDPISIGSGQWTSNSPNITFGSPLPVNVIDDGETLWRGVTNVTPSRQTSAAVEGTYGVSLSIAAAFTTGKVAYRRIGSIGTGAISAARAANLLGAAALPQLVSASADSAIQTITLPFDVVYNGQWFGQVTVGSNSWLTFAATGPSAGVTPTTPSIQIGAADVSWQRLYAGAENSGDTYRIRFEGTNAFSGTPGSPNMVWEITFDKNNPGTIKVDIGANTYKAGSLTRGTDGTNSIYTMGTDTNAGYDITQAVSALNLSSFDSLSVLIGSSTPFKGGSICLCSDTTGDTVVETLSFETNLMGYDVTTNQANSFTPIVYRKGSALSSNINSVAVYYSTDPGTVSVAFDNLIATSAANGIDHNALIGKKTSGEPWWYNIKAITRNAITIGHHTALASEVASGASRPYYGVTESVTTYMQPCTYSPYLSAQRTFAGTNALVSITGGWNRTDMSTRTGKSFIRMWGGSTAYLIVGPRLLNSLLGFGLVGLGGSVLISGATVLAADDLDFISHNSNDFITNGESDTRHLTWKVNSIVQSAQWAVSNSGGYTPDIEVGAILGSTSGSGGAFRMNPLNVMSKFTRRPRPVKIGYIANSYSYGIQAPGLADVRFKGITFSGNRLGDVNATGDGNCELMECSANPTVVHTASAALTVVNTKDQFWTAGGGGKIQGSVVHASATALQMYPTSTTLVTQVRPLMFQIGEIAVAAGVPITVKTWARKDNAGLTMGMMIPGGVLSGIETDQTANVSGVNTWEELSLTVTPTVDGVLEVWANCYGGTTFNGYITELSWST